MTKRDVTKYGNNVTIIGNYFIPVGVYPMRNKFIPLGDGESYVNTSTGEVIDDEGGFFAYVPRKSALSKLYPKGFYAMAQDPLIMLAQDDDLTGEVYKVLLYLCGKLSYDNEILIPQTEISQALKIRPPHVSRAVKLLCDKGIILKGHKAGNSWSYRLNPTYGYKGDPRGKVVSLGDGRATFRVIEGGSSTSGPEQ